MVSIRDQAELKQIERRPFADVANDAHLLLAHDIGIVLSFFVVDFHGLHSFPFAGPKGIESSMYELIFFLPIFLQICKKSRPFGKNGALIEAGVRRLPDSRFCKSLYKHLPCLPLLLV